MVEVFEFETTVAAKNASEEVAPDGMSVRTGDTTMSLDWEASPHFFLRDRLIVLYLGNDEKILEALEKICGESFAGK